MMFYLVPHFAVLGDSKMAKYRHQVYVSNKEIILLCQSLCARQQKQDPPIRLVQIIFDSLGKFNDLYTRPTSVSFLIHTSRKEYLSEYHSQPGWTTLHNIFRMICFFCLKTGVIIFGLGRHQIPLDALSLK